METEVLIKGEVKQKTEKTKSIVVYNDDFNTFAHVTECFIKYCNHEQEQALQCTYLVHFSGKCAIKNGTYDKLKPIHEALLENGLTSKIE